MFDIKKIREDFPILKSKIHGHDLVFLDSAASAQKPMSVINEVHKIYEGEYANVHRGMYQLSDVATYKFEAARKTVQEFINAKSSNEIIFTKGATEAINLVAYSYALEFLKEGDEILISEAEHHANLVPWQFVRDKKGVTLKVFKINDDGSYNQEEFEQALSGKTKLVATTAMSNAIGTIFPIKDMIKKAHEIGALILIDASQYIVHNKTDVTDLDCDFLVFSGHKTYGPSGVGCLYAKEDILNKMPPHFFGGDMVEDVTFEKTTFAKAPSRFEAGTPAIAQVIGLKVALDYMSGFGIENLNKHKSELTNYTYDALSDLDFIKMIGTTKERGGVFSFVIDGVHNHDAAFILDRQGVAIRTGTHCAQPLVNRMGVEGTIRASLGLYNNKEDINKLVEALKKVKTFF